MAKKSIQPLLPLLIELQESTNSPADLIEFLVDKGFSTNDLILHLTLLNLLKKKTISVLLQHLEALDKPTKKKKTKTATPKKKDTNEKTIYTEEEIHEIFQKNDSQINKQFTVKVLKNMYQSIYHEKPRNQLKKPDLIDAIRHRFRLMSRASSFNEGK